MASVDEEVSKAREKMFGSGGEFVFQKMDKKIHRFPAGLSAITTSYPYYNVPRLVAIGPYHHGKEHLKKMEEVKKAAASYFCQIWNLGLNDAYEKVRSNSIVGDARGNARGKYITDETIEGMKDDAYFAAMMFHDACFLLLYMDAYSRSYGRNEDNVVNKSLRRFLFSKRDSIDNDIMLLENQLPWQVVQALIDSVKAEDKQKLMTVVGKFIAGMGNTFKICEDLKPKIYEWNDEENPPPHLLALLRCHKTEKKESNTQIESNTQTESNTQPLVRNPSTPQTESNTQEDGGGQKNKEKNSISAMSPMELEEIGIKLTASKTDAFSDMAFVEKFSVASLSLSEISVAPLSLSDARASCLVNMAAFEVCTASRFGDDANKTAVCSYLALLALFMTREEDVHKLRAMGILHGSQSNTEMLNFFKSVMNHLPDCGSNFAKIMVNIEEYKVRRYIWTTLYKWVYNHFWAILKVLSILASLIALYHGIDSLNKKN